MQRHLAEALGLTAYESAGYEALLRGGVLSVSELSKASSVPRGRIYDVVQQLTDKGFCTLVHGAVKKYRAVDPEVAVAAIIESQKRAMELREQASLEAAADLKALYEANQNAGDSPLDYVQVLTSKPSMISKFKELESSAKATMRSFNKAPYVMADTLDQAIQQAQPLAERLKSGVDAYAIYEIDFANPGGFIEHLEYYQSIGEQVRVIERLPIKLLIADDQVVMLSLRNSPAGRSSLTSMVVEHTDLTSALIDLFDQYWERAQPFDEYVENRPSSREAG